MATKQELGECLRQIARDFNPTGIIVNIDSNESYDEFLARMQASMTPQQWTDYCEYWGL